MKYRARRGCSPPSAVRRPAAILSAESDSPAATRPHVLGPATCAPTACALSAFGAQIAAAEQRGMSKENDNRDTSARRSGALLRGHLRSRALHKFRIELAGLFPTENVKRLYEFADAVHLGAEQAQLNNLLVAEMLGQVLVNLVLVDSVLALFK